ncbi:hypothetical protein BKA82DRAFT_158761 [Pisolithus tinctorius]|uniref:Uncharacterized protein n=1 Tax=Pisolithus tinctorius Marx 270 TaxID=870435 RepID=A0A0C3NA90_PISTI|nr:hypothetical protein BKA82DRAFT_158761 [Pisolithus tinctorius]KIN98029.1 hypothetical protein M404DRAFT_158761 [Pisolithus tinctorius Marx 270]
MGLTTLRGATSSCGDRLAREEQEQLQQEQEREHELTLQEDKKKYHHKHVPILQDAIIPTEPIIVPAHITTCKLCKGDDCELYFFTNKGLKDAELTPQSTDNDAMALLQSGDGLHSFVLIAAAHAKATSPEMKTSPGKSLQKQCMPNLCHERQ